MDVVIVDSAFRAYAVTGALWLTVLLSWAKHNAEH